MGCQFTAADSSWARYDGSPASVDFADAQDGFFGCWFKILSDPAGTQYLVNRRDSGNVSAWNLSVAAGPLGAAWIMPASGAGSENVATAIGAWRCLIANVTAGNLVVTVDGVASAADAVGSGPLAHSVDMRFGADDSGTTNHLDGMVAEMVKRDGAASASEVAMFMAGIRPDVIWPNLDIYIPFDQRNRFASVVGPAWEANSTTPPVIVIDHPAGIGTGRHGLRLDHGIGRPMPMR